jgi:hypothetical protein
MSALSTEGGLSGTAVRAANELTSRWALALGEAAAAGTAFAGIGVWPLLGLLGAGADEQGRAELGDAFGLEGADPAAAGDAVRGVVDLFDRAPGLSLAMGIWRSQALTLHEDWLALLPPATRGVLTGNPGRDQQALDAWVQEHTLGRISKMPCQLSPSTLLVLASALTVTTQWRQKLQRKRGGARGVGAWAHTSLPLLTRDVQTSASAEDATAWLANTPAGPVTLSLVEGTDDIDVYLILGEEHRPAASVLGHGISALATVRQDAVPSTAWTGSNPAPGVTVGEIPSRTGKPMTRLECVAFDLSASHDLLAHPDVFGLGHSSSPGDRFPGIGDQPVYLQQARQNVVAEFTEEGFKAAAVTAMSMVRAAMVRPPGGMTKLTTISYTRPFGFAAVHRGSGLVLVAGWVAQPTALS